MAVARHTRRPHTSGGMASRSLAVVGSAPPSHPSHLHSASIHITEYWELPQPWGEQEGAGLEGKGEGPNQDYLSPQKLMELTGEDDLSKVTYLEFSVNTSENSLGNFGVYLPCLQQLRLVESVVECVRDLGTSLAGVTVLWLPRCRLRDLDGLPALTQLRELYLAFNEVADVSLVTMLASLEVLDLESNNLEDMDQLGYLALCPALTALTLEGNPLSSSLALQDGESGYRAAVFDAIPSLKSLDDTSCKGKVGGGGGGGGVGSGSTEEAVGLASRSSLFMLSEAGMERDWQLVHRNIKSGPEIENGVSLGPMMTAARPKTAPVPGSVGGLASSSMRDTVSPPPPPLTPLRRSSVDGSSGLTHGLNQVICGNPARALRARRQHILSSQSAAVFHSPSPSHTLSSPYHTLSPPSHTLSPSSSHTLSSPSHSPWGGGYHHPASKSMLSFRSPSPAPSAEELLSQLHQWKKDSMPASSVLGVTTEEGEGEGEGGGGVDITAALKEDGIPVTRALSQVDVMATSDEEDLQPDHLETSGTSQTPPQTPPLDFPSFLTPTPPSSAPPAHRFPRQPTATTPPTMIPVDPDATFVQLPSQPTQQHRLPTPPTATPPTHVPDRPRSVMEFRQRRFRKPSNENTPTNSLCSVSLNTVSEGRTQQAHTPYPVPPPP